jgi:septum formation protein
MIPNIILASGSPRRRALLRALGVPFEVVVSNAEESFNGAPAEMVVGNARVKRDDVAGKLSQPALVIAADTLVFLGDRVLGKPAGRDEAKEMLAALSGNTHRVLTGLALLDSLTGKSAEGYEETGVTFRHLSFEEIDRFVDAVNPVDRAGAYTVDGPGSLLVARYDGCYQNVLGFPIVRLDGLMRELGYSLFNLFIAEECRFL